MTGVHGLKRACVLLASGAVVFGLGSAQATPGELDPGFGTGGTVTTAIGIEAEGYAAALQPDGKIIVAGRSSTSNSMAATVARYNADGSLDTSFGTAGIA